MVAAGCGGVLALLRVPILALACGTMAGLLIGGTWADFQGPHDVRMTIGDAFLSHLEPFWRTVLLLTVVATASGFCCSVGMTNFRVARKGKLHWKAFFRG